MRAAVLLVLTGCATWRPGEYRPIADTGLECSHAPRLEDARGHTTIQCRELGRPETARIMVVGSSGEVLSGVVTGVARGR